MLSTSNLGTKPLYAQKVDLFITGFMEYVFWTYYIA